MPRRPRIEGDREQEILDAALDLLVDVGYDRMTFDAIASRAHVSKPSLYRHYGSKADLVVRALTTALPGPEETPDGGSLKADLLRAYRPVRGTGHDALSLVAALVPALARDRELADAFGRHVLAPTVQRTADIYRRAQDRGEMRADLDATTVAPVLAGLLLVHRHIGPDQDDPDPLERLVDDLIEPMLASQDGADVRRIR